MNPPITHDFYRPDRVGPNGSSFYRDVRQPLYVFHRPAHLVHGMSMFVVAGFGWQSFVRVTPLSDAMETLSLLIPLLRFSDAARAPVSTFVAHAIARRFQGNSSRVARHSSL